MSNTNKSAQMIDCAFVATIIPDANSGWPCAQMPGSAVFFGTRKAVKVAGTVDSHPYEASIAPGRQRDTHDAYSRAISESHREGSRR